MPFVLVTAPEVEPVSLQEAKVHLRVTSVHEDALITALIAAARQYVERETNRSLITQVWRLSLDNFPDQQAIRLGFGPVVSIDSITYRDTQNVEQTLSEDLFVVDELPADSPRVVPSPDQCFWPPAWPQPGAVTIQFTAGYGAAAAVPDALKVAIKMLVDAWFDDQRGATTAQPLTRAPMGAQALIDLFKIPLLG